MTIRIDIRVSPNSALARLIEAGKADGRTVSATLHDAAAEREALVMYQVRNVQRNGK